MNSIRAIAFDVFGTLAHIEDQRYPFAKLLRLGLRTGRMPDENDAARFMSAEVDLDGAAEMFGIPLIAGEIAALEADLAAELVSICLFPDVRETLRALRERGLKIALCLNVAAPYGPAITHLLGGQVDATVFSYQVGAVKPATAMYRRVCQALSFMPEEVLMIGSNWDTDVGGANAFGMQASHLARDGRNAHPNSMTTLAELTTLVNAGFL